MPLTSRRGLPTSGTVYILSTSSVYQRLITVNSMKLNTFSFLGRPAALFPSILPLIMVLRISLWCLMCPISTHPLFLFVAFIRVRIFPHLASTTRFVTLFFAAHFQRLSVASHPESFSLFLPAMDKKSKNKIYNILNML